MFKKSLFSERGFTTATSASFILFLLALWFFTFMTIYINFINPPKTADDLFLLNSNVIRIPVAQCEIRGIVRENQPVFLTVADEKGRAVETIPDARVFSVTDDAVQVLVRRADGDKIPPLSVNRLHVVLEPKS